MQPQHEANGRLSGAGIGWVVFVALAILTIAEYIVAIQLEKNLILLMAVALLKAAMIAWYFMHISGAWRSHNDTGDGGH